MEKNSSNLAGLLPPDWRSLLMEAIRQASFLKLDAFLEREYLTEKIYPPREDLFSAFRLTPVDRVRVVLLGQDPYHDEGQAHGLAFSVRDGVRFPPSLRNIFKELNSDLNLPIPHSGCLIPWAEQGVLMLNTVLTVQAHTPASHRKQGWEPFTDAVIQTLNRREKSLIFVLWGAPAQTKIPLIDAKRHRILCSAHPSPLSAHRGFFGSRPFSAINRFLTENGEKPIDWRLEKNAEPDLFQ